MFKKSFYQLTLFIIALALVFTSFAVPQTVAAAPATAEPSQTALQNIQPVLHDNFSDVSVTNRLWKEIVINQEMSAKKQQDASVESDGSGNTYFRPVQYNANANSDVISFNSISDVYLPDGNITSFTFRLRFQQIDAYYMNDIILYYNPADKSYIRLQIRSTNSGLQYVFSVSDSNRFSFPGGKTSGFMNIPNALTDWFTLEVCYDLRALQDNQLVFYLKYTDTDGNETETNRCPIRSTSGLCENYLAGFANSYAAKSYLVFDDVAFTVASDAEDEAANFKKYNALTLSMTDASDKAALEKTFHEYMKISGDGLRQLQNTGEKAVVENLAKQYQSNAQTAAQAFLDTHNKTLDLTVKTVKDVDKASVDAALTAVDGLTLAEKVLVAQQYQNLLEMADFLPFYTPRREDIAAAGGNKYADFEENFETNLNKWSLSLEDTYGNANLNIAEIADNPDQAGNKVLKMEQLCGYAVVPNSDAFPDDARMKTASFRLMLKNTSAFCPSIIYLQYIDWENNIYIAHQGNEFNIVKCVDGEASTLVRHIGWEDYFYPYRDSCWMTFMVTYSDSGFMSISIKSDKSDSAVTTSCTGFTRGKIGFGAMVSESGLSWKSGGIYVDDIKITMEKGDFDVDEEQKSIQVFYKGNTWYEPGDIVTVTGPNIAATVSAVEISLLQNTSPAKDAVGFVIDGDYSSLHKSNMAKSHVFNESGKQAVEIIQATTDSIKFIIPQTMERGIYSVKLIAAKTDEVNKIIYVNSPQVDYYVADEGNIATENGYIRLIGNNLVAPEKDRSKIKVAARSHSTGAYYNLQVLAINDDNYYLQVSLNALDKGEYDIYVHNGYGDNTAWSFPVTVKVADSYRGKWPDTVFDVTDPQFGAVGNGVHNDTPAFLLALEQISMHGGGILYIPEGVYRLMWTLVLPENTLVKGDGVDQTFLIWTPNYWQYGEAKDLISIKTNVEICDLNLVSTRRGDIVRQSSTVDSSDQANVYIHNIATETRLYGGGITGGTGADINPKDPPGALSIIDRKIAIEAEADKTKIFQINGVNLQLDTISYTTDALGSGQVGIHMYGHYIYMNKISQNNGWTSMQAFGPAIVENCTFTTNSCIGFQGYFYYGHSTMGPQLDNNREIFTADGTPQSSGVMFKYVGDPSIPENLVYLQNDRGQLDPSKIGKTFLAVGTQVKSSLQHYDIYISTGQGNGQARTIAAVNEQKNTITVNEEFAVNPNRNSRCIIQLPRRNCYMVDLVFDGGAGSGAYGTLIDAVYDGCVLRHHEGQVWNIHGGVVWYLSIVNQTVEGAYYVHNNNIGDQSGWSHTSFPLQLSTSKRSLSATLIKNCSWTNRAYIAINPIAPSTGAATDLVLQDCSFERGSTAFELGDSSIVKSMDGVIFKGNYYGTAQIMDSKNAALFNNSAVKNATGSLKYINLDVNTSMSVLYIGDVNGDGKIGLKDITLIKYYLAGEVEFSAQQLALADYNRNSSVNLKDITQMKKDILNNTILYNLLTQEDIDRFTGGSSSSSSSNISSDVSTSVPVSSDAPVSSGSSSVTSETTSSSSGSTGAEEWHRGTW